MRLHHLGFVTQSIEKYINNFPGLKQFATVIDGFQGAKISILSKGQNDLIIELIEPITERSTVFGALKKYGDHFHHFCYEVESEELLEIYVEQLRLRKITDWVQAPVFKDRQVCFYYSREGRVVEFIK